jgi:Spy/CpxP family protein refolding chaperone
MGHRRSLAAALGAALFSLVALAQQSAFATFGGPSHDPFFDGHDFLIAKMTTSQIQAFSAARQQIVALRAPIEQQISALRGQITEQLSGPGTIDAGQIAGLEQQMFALRRQRDALDLHVALQARAAMTPEQLTQVAQRHEQLADVREQREAILNPSDYPKSSYLPGDLFGDSLGYTRGVTLTDAQQQQISDITEANVAAFQSIQQQRHANRLEILRLVMGNAPVTQAQLAPLLNRASTLKEQIDDRRLAMTIQIRTLLTPEQLAQAATLHQQLVALRDAEKSANHPAETAN